MKLTLLAVMLLGAAAFAFGEGNNFGIGVDGNIYNNTQSASSKSDFVSNSIELRVFAVIPLSETMEVDPSASVALYSTKDPSGLVTTAGYAVNQNGAGAGLGFYAALANAGPFTLMSGLLGEVKYLGIPDNLSGDWTYWNAHLALPLFFKADVSPSVSLRVTQTVLDLYGRSRSYANASSGFSALQFNQFGPSVGCVYKF